MRSTCSWSGQAGHVSPSPSRSGARVCRRHLSGMGVGSTDSCARSSRCPLHSEPRSYSSWPPIGSTRRFGFGLNLESRRSYETASRSSSMRCGTKDATKTRSRSNDDVPIVTGLSLCFGLSQAFEGLVTMHERQIFLSSRRSRSASSSGLCSGGSGSARSRGWS